MDVAEDERARSGADCVPHHPFALRQSEQVDYSNDEDKACGKERRDIDALKRKRLRLPCVHRQKRRDSYPPTAARTSSRKPLPSETRKNAAPRTVPFTGASSL